MRSRLTPDVLHEAPSAALSRVFSSRVVRELGTLAGRVTLRRLVQECGVQLDSDATVEEFYDCALEALLRRDRNEYTYKNAIAQKLLLGKHSTSTRALFFEFRTAQSKLDALFLGESSHAYEIKTAQDELRRLPTQIADYQKLFTHVWVFTSQRHLNSLRQLVGPEIGIAILSDRYHISVVRRAQKRVKYLDPQAMLASMRQAEYRSALRELGLEIPPTPNTLIHSIAMEAAKRVDPQAFHDVMVRHLRARFKQDQAQTLRVFPRSLAATAIALSVSKAQAERIGTAIRTKLGEL